MTLPAPCPADTRAKGWRFELGMERARQSDTWAIAAPDARPWLLMLWATAWEQTPCGSLPDDDELIAARIGMPAKLFAKHRAILLRKWWLADDGRLYHAVLVQRVLEMMKTRRSESDRKAAARAREASRMADGVTQESGAVPVMSHGTTAGLHPESGTGTGTGTKESQTPFVPDRDQNATPTIPCPYAQIVDAYHELLPSLPKAKLLPASRQRALRKLWGWVLSSSKSDGQRRATTSEEAIGWVRGYFARASLNEFLMGRTPRGVEHANWQCDLDFLLSEKGMKQVIEKTQDAA